MATGTIISLIIAILGAVAGGFKLWTAFFRDKKVEDAFQAGRNDVRAQVSKETLDVKEAMDDVPRPTDDAVADSLQRGKF